MAAKLRLEMLSLFSLLVSVLLIFFAAFSEGEYSRILFIVGAVLALISFFLKFVGLMVKS